MKGRAIESAAMRLAWPLAFLFALLLPVRPVDSQTPASQASRGPTPLAGALALKETRRLDETIPRLEALAAKDGEAPTAASVLGELEAIDARLRLFRFQGLERRLDRLDESWGRDLGIRRRVLALRSLLHIRSGSLLEPNAISRADLGDRFRARFLPQKPGGAPRVVPLDFPIRFLCDLSPRPGSGLGGGRREGAVTLLGFVGIEELGEARRDALKPVLEHFDRDPRALAALFVFASDFELLPPRTAEEPWNRLAIFWIRGTPQALSSTPVPVRSRYEWLPLPAYFILEPGARIRSWRWPHEGWDGFLLDAGAAFEGRSAEGKPGRK